MALALAPQSMFGDDNVSLLREYLSWMTDERRCSSLTAYQYAAKLQKLLEFLGDRPLALADGAMLRSWLHRPRRGGKPAAAATLAGDLAVLKSFFGYLHAAERIPRDPTILLPTPKVTNTQPKAIADDVWQRVWSSRLHYTERVFLGLGFYCGLRRMEIVDLRPSHFVGLQIRGFVRKGGGEDTFDVPAAVGVYADFLPHLLPDPETFLGDLRHLLTLRRQRAYLLPWGEDVEHWVAPLRSHAQPQGRTNPDQLNKRLARILVRAGLSADTFTPHALRHSFVTNLLRAGVPLHLVSTLANHRNIQTTMRYVKVGASPLAQWAQERKAFSLAEVPRFG